ncbi:hypothetical protein AVEN_34608-1 [Araneus ventricosus]|uniref:Uncharacterized protein n=1 Tax=Araneus ventricosus TaxID=182803 RepID=A0A4Y2AZX7_ARAVE|nr:hypothetical protein AVEN_34608-1 [Araneus ventricosus]
MHKLYIEKCNAENVQDRFKVKQCTYRNIFNNEFNLSFGHPKSDTYKAAFEAQQADRELARISHRTVYITLDFQQTMPLPRPSASKAFYLCQMWFYNLRIHIITSDVEKKLYSAHRQKIKPLGVVVRFSVAL